MKLTALLAVSGIGGVALAQAVPADIKAWVEIGGVIAAVASSLAIARHIAGLALAEAKEAKKDAKDLGDELARLRVQVAGIEGKATDAEQEGLEAQRVAQALHKRLDEDERKNETDQRALAEWKGTIVGKVDAWHSRAEDIGKNVHTLRNDVGQMVGRLEERMDRKE